MRLDLFTEPKHSSRRRTTNRSSTSKSGRVKSRRSGYNDDSSIISSSTPLPITPSAGMVFDANGIDIGQALALKVSLSEVRIKDARARAAKEKREKKERKGLDSTGNWISTSLSNLTSDFSLDGTGSLASKNSQSSTSTRGRIVKETLIGNLTDPTMPRVPPRKTSSYIPSKYATPETPAESGGGLFGLFNNTYACDGRQDVDDTDSTYTAHRDERGVVLYEV